MQGQRGYQRLSLKQLRAWESLQYGMFIHYGMSTFDGNELSDGKSLMSLYAPDRLDVNQWISVARDAGILGKGYRTFLFNHIASLQQEIVIMMNTGFGDGSDLKIDYAWPSDLVAIERELPPESGHEKWKVVNGKEYYVPGEVCDPIGKEWFFKENDPPRSDEVLLRMYTHCNKSGVNLLLNVPPYKHGLLPDEYIQALMRLRKNADL